jgi:hypothetical protein
MANAVGISKVRFHRRVKETMMQFQVIRSLALRRLELNLYHGTCAKSKHKGKASANRLNICKRILTIASKIGSQLMKWCQVTKPLDSL